MNGIARVYICVDVGNEKQFKLDCAYEEWSSIINQLTSISSFPPKFQKKKMSVSKQELPVAENERALGNINVNVYQG